MTRFPSILPDTQIPHDCLDAPLAKTPTRRHADTPTRFPSALAFALLFVSCAQFQTSPNTDLSIDTYSPPADALAIAETHAKEYWAKHQEQIGSDATYLAIQTDTIFSDQIPDLYRKLEYSPGVSSSDLEDYGNNNHLEVYCVNLFNTRTGKLSPNGYAVVDLPRVGHLARFGTSTAIYIGRGG